MAFEVLLNFLRRHGLLMALLAVALFVRVYRLDALLGFYFDQGRDALVIHDFLTHRKLFLIGPTTGIEGIFLGPLYYITLIPWYFLGQGNPVFPAFYLAATTLLAIYVLFVVSSHLFGKRSAYIFLLLSSFSYYLIVAARWLANPTQLMLASSLTLYGLWKVTRGRGIYWLLVAAGIAASLQFEAASAVFFLPAIFVFALLYIKQLPTPKVAFLSLAVFLISLLPQAFFDFRHEHLLVKAFAKFLISDRSFNVSLGSLILDRLNFFIQSFGSKLFPNNASWLVVAVAASAFVIFAKRQKLVSRQNSFLWVWIIVPLVGLLLYQGNHGYVWDYYLTGIYLPFFVLFSAILSSLSSRPFGKLLVYIFFAIFFFLNLPFTRNYLVAGVNGPTNITLGNEKQAVNWVYRDSGSQPFNYDIYVPPVVPYAYDYLFTWIGSTVYHKNQDANLVPRLYTLYEVDPLHPERLAAWLTRQNTIGGVESIVTFGGITVERRLRYLPQ